MKKYKIKGSLTVEASLVLPVFILAILTLAFYIRVINTQERVDFVLTDTANTISTEAYLYQATRLQDIQVAIDDLVANDENPLEYMKGLRNNIMLATNQLKSIENKDFNQSDFPRLINSFVLNFRDMANCIQQSINHIDNLEKSILKESFHAIINKIGQNATKKIFYSKLGKKELKELGIIDEIDFHKSKFLYQEKDYGYMIDIVIEYKIKVPDPLGIFNNYKIVQSKTVYPWLGDGRKGAKTNYSWQKAKTEKNKKVIIIGQGKRYHKASCEWLNRKKIPILLQDVKKHGQNPGLKPCTRCGNRPFDRVVYITPKGEKYHHEDCSYFNPKIYWISLEKAIEEGYTPCKTCY